MQKRTFILTIPILAMLFSLVLGLAGCRHHRWDHDRDYAPEHHWEHHEHR